MKNAMKEVIGRLYFQTKGGEKNLVKASIKENQVGMAIYDYVRTLNPDYITYYIRHWEVNNSIIYDFGSWSEFFIFVPDENSLEEK